MGRVLDDLVVKNNVYATLVRYLWGWEVGRSCGTMSMLPSKVREGLGSRKVL